MTKALSLLNMKCSFAVLCNLKKWHELQLLLVSSNTILQGSTFGLIVETISMWSQVKTFGVIWQVLTKPYLCEGVLLYQWWPIQWHLVPWHHSNLERRSCQAQLWNAMVQQILPCLAEGSLNFPLWREGKMKPLPGHICFSVEQMILIIFLSTLLDGCWRMLTNDKHDLTEVSLFILVRGASEVEKQRNLCQAG